MSIQSAFILTLIYMITCTFSFERLLARCTCAIWLQFRWNIWGRLEQIPTNFFRKASPHYVLFSWKVCPSFMTMIALKLPLPTKFTIVPHGLYYDQISAESKAIFVIFNQAQVHASTRLFASKRASKGSSRNLQNQKGSCYHKLRKGNHKLRKVDLRTCSN